jgi:hypothetical protein
MSDLAPFVASVLYDRVLAETKQEVDRLSEQLQKSRAVQIICESGRVYAEAQLQDGSYSGNPHFWTVNLKNLAACPLSDLAGVDICIGGICKAHFGVISQATSIIDVVGVDRDDDSTYMDGWGFINFCFGGAGQCWLSVKVGPFPSEEAFFSQFDRDIDPESVVSLLTEEVAVNHPQLSVTFEHVDFFVTAVKNFILNLDPAIEEEAERRRQQLHEENEAFEEESQRRRAVAMAENGVDDGTDGEDDEESNFIF